MQCAHSVSENIELCNGPYFHFAAGVKDVGIGPETVSAGSKKEAAHCAFTEPLWQTSEHPAAPAARSVLELKAEHGSRCNSSRT